MTENQRVLFCYTISVSLITFPMYQFTKIFLLKFKGNHNIFSKQIIALCQASKKRIMIAVLFRYIVHVCLYLHLNKELWRNPGTAFFSLLVLCISWCMTYFMLLSSCTWTAIGNTSLLKSFFHSEYDIISKQNLNFFLKYNTTWQ